MQSSWSFGKKWLGEEKGFFFRFFFFFLVVLYDLRYLPLPGIEPMFSAVEAWNPNH